MAFPDPPNISARISQVSSIFSAARRRFCYKNHEVVAYMERRIWHTRWVNRNRGAFGSFLTVDLTDIPHIPSKFVEFVPLSHRQGNCIPYAAIRWHDFGNRPALGRPLGHFSRHPDTPLLSLSPRRRFPRPTPERVFVADHQSSSGFSGTGPSAPPPQPIGT